MDTQLGSYRIESEIGSGGMGTVFLARDEADRKVAVKVIHSHLLTMGGVFKRFLREADVGKQVQHENVVRTLDADAVEVDGKTSHFLVMEYVEGQTLRSLLAEMGKAPEGLCRHIGREAARALDGIHGKGVVHRDIKPENILITEANVVKVMDLGLARLQDEAVRLSRAGEFAGSVQYAAPEQFQAAGEDLDGRADLYALGLVLFELATGVHPFADDDLVAVMHAQVHTEPPRPAELNPQLSPFFEEVIWQLLRKNRDERIASASHLVRILDEGESASWWHRRSVQIREETKRPLRRIRIPRETGLYGRDEEISAVREGFVAATRGEGRVLLVEGEAGVGKTRLMDEAAARLRSDGHDFDFLYGSYPPGGAATASGAFNSAYRDHLGEENLEERLAALLGERSQLVPAFAAMLKGAPPPEGVEPLSREAVQAAFARTTRALGQQRPTIVLIDDLHFAPDEGRALFASLAAAVAEEPILLLGGLRPGVPEAWMGELNRLPHVAHRPVSRLGPKDLHDLLEEALGSSKLAEELGGKIAWKSDGNPFFVFEILQGLRAEGLLSKEDDGSWKRSGIIRDLTVPSSLRDLIRGRIADLDEEDRNLLEMAACDGFEFDPTLVGQALEMGAIPVLRRLGRMEKEQRLVHATGRKFVFDHHQVQEALYEGLPELLREEYHAALGETLEATTKAADADPKELDADLVVALCEHFLKGNRGERAKRYLLVALEHLAESYRNSPALDLADRALNMKGLLEGGERAETMLLKARRLNLLGRWDEEREMLEEAYRLATEAGDEQSSLMASNFLGNLHVNRGRYQQALEVVTPALDLARESGNHQLEGFLMVMTGNAHGYRGEWEESRRCFECSIEVFQRGGLEEWVAFPTANLSMALAALGAFDEAKAAHDRADQLPDNLVRGLGYAILYGYRTALYRDLGDYEAAAAWGLRTQEASEEIGYRWGIATALQEWGAAEAEQGRSGDAEKRFRKALEIRRDIQYHAGIAETLISMGCQRLQREPLEEALEIAERIGTPTPQLLASCYLALAGVREPERARADLEALRDRVRRRQLLEATYILWKATRDPALLEDAGARLDALLAGMPEERRDPALKKVPLYRDVAGARSQS